MITRAQLSRQASFIAKNAADWAADTLWDDEGHSKPVGDKQLKRFTSMIRDRLEIIEEMHKREPN